MKYIYDAKIRLSWWLSTNKRLISTHNCIGKKKKRKKKKKERKTRMANTNAKPESEEINNSWYYLLTILTKTTSNIKIPNKTNALEKAKPSVEK